MRKRLISFTVLVVGAGLIINLSQDIWRLWKAQDQLGVAEQRLEELEEEYQLLLEKKKYYQSDDFIESEARNKLNMSRPGEVVVILPPNIEELAGQGEPGTVGVEEIPNWKKWWKLFF